MLGRFPRPSPGLTGIFSRVPSFSSLHAGPRILQRSLGSHPDQMKDPSTEPSSEPAAQPSSAKKYDYPLCGLFAVHKPSGVTSMSLLESLKKLFLTSKLFVKDPQSGEGHPDKKSKRWNKNRKFKKDAKLIKIGQGGTLDPLASGVLVIGLNSATRQLSKFLDCSKVYRTTGLLGCRTDSYDSQGKIIELVDWKHVTPEDIRDQCESIKGEQWQTPPIYSALKMDGKPLYEYARQNIPLPRPIEARRCEIFDIKMIDWNEGGQHSYRWPTEMASQEDRKTLQRTEELVKQIGVVKSDSTPKSCNESSKQDESNKLVNNQPSNQSVKRSSSFENKSHESKKFKLNDGSVSAQPSASELPAPTTSGNEAEIITLDDNGKSPAFTLEMTVSSGTYVRSIVHDIGQAVSSAATVVSLIRTRQGDFYLDPSANKTESSENCKALACIEWSTFEKAIQSLKDGVDGSVNQAGLKEWEQELLDHIHV